MLSASLNKTFPSFIHSFIHSFPRSLFQIYIWSLKDNDLSGVALNIHSFIHSFIPSFPRSLFQIYIWSLKDNDLSGVSLNIHSFIHSFIPSFVVPDLHLVPEGQRPEWGGVHRHAHLHPDAERGEEPHPGRRPAQEHHRLPLPGGTAGPLHRQQGQYRGGRLNGGARRGSVVCWVVGSIHRGGPVELVLVSANVPRLVKNRGCGNCCPIWDGAYKRSLAANNG